MRRTNPTLPPISHQQLRVKVTCAMRRTLPTLPPIIYQQLRVEVMCNMEDQPYLTLIGHQQLRVEVTCNEKDPPYPNPNWSYYMYDHIYTEFHHCGGTQCLGLSDLNEMCKVQVTVIGHLQVIVTLTYMNNPTPK